MKRMKYREVVELERAQKTLAAAQVAFDLKLKNAFRPGDRVMVHHARPFEAEVVEVSGVEGSHGGATLAVRNVKTGIMRWRISIAFVTTEHYRGEYVPSEVDEP